MAKKAKKKRIRTITRVELQRLSFCNSDRLPRFINDDDVRYEWTGIGWFDFGKQITGHEVKVVDE